MKEENEVRSSDPKNMTLRVPYRPAPVKATLVTYDSLETGPIKNTGNEEPADNVIATYWG